MLATAISVSSTTFVVITDRASTLPMRGGHFKIRFPNTGCSPSRGKASRGTFTFLRVATDAMEYFQAEVMDRKEARITFLRKFFPFDPPQGDRW